MIRTEQPTPAIEQDLMRRAQYPATGLTNAYTRRTQLHATTSILADTCEVTNVPTVLELGYAHREPPLTLVPLHSEQSGRCSIVTAFGCGTPEKNTS